MSYLVLARKYRPHTLAEIVGQDVTLGTLRGAIEEDRVGHAYLFSGPRGTGKTTTARALAKCLNCEQGPTVTPCGTCDRCRASDAGAEADIVEIDAASHTGVDYVRELRDQAAYAPMSARFKVYIIDEVHMLSRSAFNALLKTLEEPPSHVKFFFATTELHKVPDTIRSRCQLMRLEPLTESEIAGRLDWVFQQESVEAEAGVAAELARRARGGMRDALSLADQLLALVGERPRLEDLERLSGDGGGREVDLLLTCIENADKVGVLGALPDSHGGEAGFLELVLDHLRSCLLASLCGAEASALGEEAAVRERCVSRAGRLGTERLQLMLEELLHTRGRIEALPGHARLMLEVTLLALCDERSTMPLSELVARLEALETGVGSGSARVPTHATTPTAPSAPAPAASAPAAPVPAASAPAASAPAAPAPAASAPAAPAPAAPAPAASAPAPAAASPRKGTTPELWTTFIEALRASVPSVAEVLSSRGKLVEHVPGRAVVQLSRLADSERALVQDARNAKTCSRVFSEVAGDPVEVVLEDNASTRPGSKDPYTQKVADLFSGRIEDER
jgi:DNA polymerase-3 subunit gamma/tau